VATIIALVAVVVAIVALGYAWKLNNELATASRRLDRYNKAIFDLNDEMRRLREDVEEENAQTRVALRRQQGTEAFTPEMTVREVLMVHPQSAQVMASFHLGGCSDCGVEPNETLLDVCQQRGVDLQALVGNLNLLTPGRQQAGDIYGAPQLVKLPNVALEFE
jgi:hybrid cluster-associated redox disulfide protein